jgi:hypothetical protein
MRMDTTQHADNTHTHDKTQQQQQEEQVEAKDTRTKSEIQFEAVQKRREAELLRKKLTKSYRERIDEYNSFLSNLSEIHDIPRYVPCLVLYCAVFVYVCVAESEQLRFCAPVLVTALRAHQPQQQQHNNNHIRIESMLNHHIS